MTGRDDAGAHLDAHEERDDERANASDLTARRSPSPPGQTVMQAALAAGVYIPHLCWHPDFRRTARASCAR
jgi:predicted molibdopterin-dependent oxidoreductase YjgC